MPEFATILRRSLGLGRACAAALLLALGLAQPASAQGDLLVAPTRVVLNGGGSSEVVLSNIGATPATYRISLELRRMTPEGDLETIEEADMTAEQKAMLEMFRYAPRRIVLPPNQPQSVRISARPPEGLGDGEYRVHMSFRAIPDAQPVEAGDQQAPASGFSIRLVPVYGISIPVILRKGNLSATASLANPAVVREGGETVFRVDINRTGTRSVYGEVRVMAPGAKQPAFLVRGIAVYPEVSGRTLKVDLTPAQAAAFKGPMTIEYREMPEQGGKLLASTPASF